MALIRSVASSDRCALERGGHTEGYGRDATGEEELVRMVLAIFLQETAVELLRQMRDETKGHR